jgi:uridine kinase
VIYIVGIAGGSGSGKTTFTQKIKDQIGSDLSVIHMDSYYHAHPGIIPKTDDQKLNFDHPDAFDWELLKSHLSQIKKGEEVEIPNYDFVSNSRTVDTHKVKPTKVVLFEGIFSFYDPKIRNLLDVKCFLHVEADIRFTRRLHRDVKERGRDLDSIISQYYETVRPMYQKYLNPQKEFADFIVGEETDTAATILSARIKELIG